MLISNKHNFIFIHIYKNAGTSITSALKPFAQGRVRRAVNRTLKSLKLPAPFFDHQPYHTHVKASELREDLGHEMYDSYFSFAIVRNPWDWQVSLYKYMLKDATHHQHELGKKLGSFDEYIRWRCDHEIRYQKDFLYSDDNQLLVNFVGRYENLAADFQAICARIGVSASLPKLNVSNTQPYRELYSDHTRELVKQAFRPDLDLLKYEF